MFFFYLGKFLDILGVLGVVLGLLVMMAGRLFVQQVKPSVEKFANIGFIVVGNI